MIGSTATRGDYGSTIVLIQIYHSEEPQRLLDVRMLRCPACFCKDVLPIGRLRLPATR